MVTSAGGPSDQTSIIRRHPTGSFPAQPDPPSGPAPAVEDPSSPRTTIIRRVPTGAFPALAEPSGDDVATGYVHAEGPATGHVPQTAPPSTAPAMRRSPAAACATATAGIVSGWATAVIATSLIAGWWRTDQLFCVAVGFLTTVSAAATIGGLIALLLRRLIGRLLVIVGSVVALMIFAGLFVAGAALPPIVYAIPALPVVSVGLAMLPATGRWCTV